MKIYDNVVILLHNLGEAMFTRSRLRSYARENHQLRPPPLRLGISVLEYLVAA